MRHAPWLIAGLALHLFTGCGDVVVEQPPQGGGDSPETPAQGCPEQAPGEGTPCAGTGLRCAYPDDTWCPSFLAVCSGDGTWEVEVPPDDVCSTPTLYPCHSFLTERECVAQVGHCRWRVPGCADSSPFEALPQAGCFAQLPCYGPQYCYPDQTCVTRIVAPCVGAECSACGASASVCLAL
ncbi:hypothetical protein [Chondromyces crocatus]|uniref:Uncharacterized protein n=1 Tax=Chondromyces crocatus TaxID=52 RepID=A0A0K1EFG4_CHOCO|nr:hypothetical protein [Chondromyces crocatus]AKT39328.1 uncharacterized protein CMC5_034750 [Chondromyces crocatus]